MARLPVGISLTDGIDGLTGSRLYAESASVEYDVWVSNESQASIFVDQDVLRRVFTIGVELEGSEIAVDVGWPDDVTVQEAIVDGSKALTRFASWQPVQLNPGESAGSE